MKSFFGISVRKETYSLFVITSPLLLFKITAITQAYRIKPAMKISDN
jgi:hypothetical protein